MMIIINIKEILRKTIKQKNVENRIMEQSRVGKYFNQNFKDPVIAHTCIRYLKSSENILRIVLSEVTCIRQQIIATTAYREQKLWKNVDETNCRVCCNCQEIVP